MKGRDDEKELWVNEVEAGGAAHLGSYGLKWARIGWEGGAWEEGGEGK